MSGDQLYQPVADGLTVNDAPGMRPADLAYAERQPFERIRARLDDALQVTGERPFCPQVGQSPEAYRRQLLQVLAPHTETYKRLNTGTITVDSADRFEHRIVSEAMTEPIRNNTLAAITKKDRTGRQITEYVGSIDSWMGMFKATPAESAIFVNGKPKAAPAIF
ncbi:hypothetical protein [Caballeronia sp. ATUFL_M2_KS44]|uniref:hypothetical protein n=1 Tax=Caballeronia sp. ATUFL_M2_KS44 TaxID=2921767 RepID=UPI002027A62D|nr:hypothetical protein [Caballeronia sp. ATUFL_M2_KS44]